MRRIKKLGFMARNSSVGGKNILKRKRAKGKKSLSVSEEYKLLRKKKTKNIR